ncbi:hypothetical protein [Peribacillus sp. NPDC096540]|uniref:hypothetical protein n=1 Tax=Peribacillus sp. NPDC096540 TaxID=3390612 RepID=UPI003D059AEB
MSNLSRLLILLEKEDDALKPVDTYLLSNALKDALSFGVRPHELGCTEEELDEMY